jgi:hypothetical protein
LRPSTGYTIGRGKARAFQLGVGFPLSYRVAKQSDGSRLIAAVKVHNLARAVPEKSHQPNCFGVVLTVVLSPSKQNDQKRVSPAVVFRWSGIPFQERRHPLADSGHQKFDWSMGGVIGGIHSAHNKLTYFGP